MKNRKFKIGDKVLFEGIEHTIVAYAGFYSKSYIIKCPCRMHPEKHPNQVEDDFPLKCNKGDCLLFVNEKELTLIEDKTKRKFKIGDRVLYQNKEHLIVAYFKENPCVHYVIKGPKGIHSGTLDEAILEDGSHYCPIIKSYDHIYVGENELTLIERKNMKNGVVKLSLEDAKKLYEQGGNFRTIALSAYSEDELKEPELPNTWEEFCKNYPVKEGEAWISEHGDIMAFFHNCNGRNDKNNLPNKETAKAVLALCQLIQLRDCYNQGWKPDWTDDNPKYIIRVWKDEFYCNDFDNASHVMSFKTEKLRDKFLNNFRDLLEQAKELL